MGTFIIFIIVLSIIGGIYKKKSKYKVLGKGAGVALKQPPVQYDHRVNDLNLSFHQILESFSIIARSPNPDTVIGRYEFVKNHRYSVLLTNYLSEDYFMNFSRSLDHFKILYPGTEIDERWIDLILEPNFDKLDYFYIECLILSYQRFYERQSNEIEKLKRPDAKDRRKTKIDDVAKIVIDELNKYPQIKDTLQIKIGKL